MSNMYPDLNDDQNNADASVPKANYQATGTPNEHKRKKDKKKDNCCISGAKIWVTIMGVLGLLLGVVFLASALYAKFGYHNYEQLRSTLPSGGIWMIAGFGGVLAFCSIILILAAKFFENACFKIILFIFALVLAILLILEVVGAAVLAWGLNIITLPKSSATDAAEEHLIEARDAAFQATYQECCITNVPPYNLANISKIDSACLWPGAADAVKKACGAQDVQQCVCAQGDSQYGAYFGLFLKSQLLWVSVVIIVLAVLLLGGLICTCILVWAKKEERGEKGFNVHQ